MLFGYQAADDVTTPSRAVHRDVDGQGEKRGNELNRWRKQMTKETQSYVDMLRNFGSTFGLPQVDVEKLLETNCKNLEALGELAKVAAGGAQSVAADRGASSPTGFALIPRR